MEGTEDGIVAFDRQLFGQGGVVAGNALDADVAPEIEDLLADGVLEAPGEGEGKDHRADADYGSADGQPEDEPGKGPLAVEGNPAGNEGGDVQMLVINSEWAESPLAEGQK